MKRIRYLALLLLSFYLIACRTDDENKDGQKKEIKARWEYSGDYGPNRWGKISSDYSLCGDGTRQSPIDMNKTIKTDLPNVYFKYYASNFNIIDNEYTIQAEFKGDNRSTFFGEEYKLTHINFHTPSEHTINEKSYDMEAHLIHKNSKDELAIASVLIAKGKSNSFLQILIDNFPAEKNKNFSIDNIDLNPSLLLPKNLSYYTYFGSLTTPPCSENVLWIILKNPIEASQSQIENFNSKMGTNARPVLPVNKRFVLESK